MGAGYCPVAFDRTDLRRTLILECLPNPKARACHFPHYRHKGHPHNSSARAQAKYNYIAELVLA
jgi:hypothetical protein